MRADDVLPHRAPFLFVDEVDEVPEGAHATEKGLSPWHWIRHPFKHLPSPLPKLPAMAAVEPLRP